MNNRFFLLEMSKQEQIINSGYKVFAQNTYKKASMSVIAGDANISKFLLFHYFQNKKELYLYLYQKAIDVLDKAMPDKENDDLFELLKTYMENRWRVLKQHPYLIEFISKVYYEEEESLQKDLQEMKKRAMVNPFMQLVWNSSALKNRNEDDRQMIIKMLLYMSEGFAFENKEKIINNPEVAIKELSQLLLFMKNILG